MLLAHWDMLLVIFRQVWSGRIPNRRALTRLTDKAG